MYLLKQSCFQNKKQFTKKCKTRFILFIVFAVVQTINSKAQTSNAFKADTKNYVLLVSEITSPKKPDKIILLKTGLGVVKKITKTSDGTFERIHTAPGVAAGFGYQKIRFTHSKMIFVNSTEFLSKGSYLNKLTTTSTVSRDYSQLYFLQIGMELGRCMMPKQNLFFSAGFFYGFRDFGMNAIGSFAKLGSFDDDEWGLKFSALKKNKRGFWGINIENGLKSPINYQGFKTFRCSLQYSNQIFKKSKKQNS